MMNSKKLTNDQISYSQLGQDLWVLEQFPINNGYFVDIGFANGVKNNNTYLLELNGWHGIGIDPRANNYDDRKNTTIYKRILYSKHDIKLNFISAGVYSGLESTIDCHQNMMTDNKKLVKTTTLLRILLHAKAPKFIHYLSLDTEGSEYEILRTFPFEKYSFGCLTIEHNHVQPKRNNIQQLLESKGYKLDKHLEWDDCYINTLFSTGETSK